MWSSQPNSISAGRAFLPEAEDLLRRGEAGSATFGLIPAASFPAKAVFPGRDLILKELTTSEQQDGIAARRLNIGLVRPLRIRHGIGTIRVMRNPFVLALPTWRPLAERAEITIGDLDRQRFIMYSPAEERYSCEILAGVFYAAGIEPAYVQFFSRLARSCPWSAQPWG